MSVVKIKDRDNLVKNLDTGAVINTDTLAYEKRIKIRFEAQRQRDQLRDAVREINSIKSEMHEMKSLLLKLVGKQNG